ncbi:MAG TPA: hypothetical protein VM346_04190 [Sphingomicrobium sp.]|nr:hypothetical protein [Sphingomicrobium sp.]
MTMMTKILAGGAGLAAFAAAGPAVAQWAPYGHANPYGHASPYGAPYGHAYGYHSQQHQMTQMATQRCAAAVHHRLNSRNQAGISGILGAVLGANTAAQARVVSFTQVRPTRHNVRVHGLATSGRMAGYGPYGVGAYGALGYAHQPDLTFRCDVDYRGNVRNVRVDRRR